jgi:hypothetical protein
MSPDGKPRRACALLKVGRGQPARPMVAKRPLFSYWAILMPHFRGVLLPPQNRSDESIQWTWTEPADGDAISAAELATIRKRLAGAQQSLADALDDTSGLAAKAAAIRETKNRMDEVVGALVALSDPALAGFVARTDRGMLLHSWGLANPLPVQYLDADYELAGRVIVGGAPAAGEEVLLETIDGASVGRTGTDREGRFEFPKVAAGSYRVRAVSRPPEVFFSEKGEVVELLGSAITTIEIHNEDRTRNIAPVVRGNSSGHLIGILVSAVAVILVVAVYYFWPRKGSVPAAAAASKSASWEVNSAPRAVAQHGEVSDDPKGRSAQTGIAANVASQQTPKKSSVQKSPSGAPPEQRNSRAADIVVAQRASGLPPQQAGQPVAAGGLPGGSATSGAGGVAGGGHAGDHSAGPAGGGNGNAGGSPGSGAEGPAPSANPTTSSPSSRPQVISPPAPANSAPPAGQPQGSRTPEAPPSRGSNAKAQAESANPVGADSRPANDFQAANHPAANVPDKAAAVAAANHDAPTAVVSFLDSDSSDSPAPVPEETNDEKKPDKNQEPMSENGSMHPSFQPPDEPAEAGTRILDSDFSPSVRMSFRLSPWRRFLLRDTILPTLPTPIGQKETLGDLSTRVLAEKQTALPRTLRDGNIVVGICIEFPRAAAGPLPRWQVADGTTPTIATANESIAEIGWRGEPPAGRYVLTAADGKVLASISTDPQGEMRVSGTGAISSWPWVGIECAPGEAGRFGWQVLGTAPRPAGWTKDNHWMDDGGLRLDLKMLVEKDETVVLTLAIVDGSTGWALASKVEHQQKLHR